MLHSTQLRMLPYADGIAVFYADMEGVSEVISPPNHFLNRLAPVSTGKRSVGLGTGIRASLVFYSKVSVGAVFNKNMLECHYSITYTLCLIGTSLLYGEKREQGRGL